MRRFPWRKSKRLPLVGHVNGALFGAPDAGEGMAFGFPAMISHVARTRNLGAGTIIGAGTVSNAERSRGVSCPQRSKINSSSSSP